MRRHGALVMHPGGLELVLIGWNSDGLKSVVVAVLSKFGMRCTPKGFQ